jgi:pimeloyl-ACP methyl ester carboxylesterase
VAHSGKLLRNIAGTISDPEACRYGACSPAKTLGIGVSDEFLRQHRDSLVVTLRPKVGRNWMIKLDYKRIAAPTMILWGARDIFLDPKVRFRLKNDIVNAPVRVQLVEDAGHFCHVERPDYVAETILDFVSEHRGMGALAQPYRGGLVDE